MEHEKRAFSRVATFVRAHMRPMSGPDAPVMFNASSQATSLAGLSLKESKLPDVLVQFLLEMSQKLDLVVSHLSREQLQDDFPHAADVVELSGAGVQMRTDMALVPGDVLEIVLVLSLFPLRLAGAVGKVIRALDTAPVDGGTLWAVDFIRIRENDLDAVVQHVFNEERQHIRERKWE